MFVLGTFLGISKKFIFKVGKTYFMWGCSLRISLPKLLIFVNTFLQCVCIWMKLFFRTRDKRPFYLLKFEEWIRFTHPYSSLHFLNSETREIFFTEEEIL